MFRAITRRARNTVAPGQRVLIGQAPRFGLPKYLHTHFTVPRHPMLKVANRSEPVLTLDREALDTLPETTKTLDLHCVMTWSVEGTRWTGWRFTDVWTHLLREHAHPSTIELVFTGLDGAAASIPLTELLRDDVMIAHSRDGEPLARDHGAPYRLVVPHLYGYKNVKHVSTINMVDHHVRSPYEPWIMHAIGRVDREERYGLGMNRLVRLTNGILVGRTLRSYGLHDPRFRKFTRDAPPITRAP